MNKRNSPEVGKEVIENALLCGVSPVDRESQIALFRRILDQVCRRGFANHNLLEWFGVPGIGKSTLVSLLLQECKLREIPAISINFKELQNRMCVYLNDPVTLIEDMVSILIKDMVAILGESYPLDTESLQEKIKTYRAIRLPGNIIQAYSELSKVERLEERPKWLRALDEVVTRFVELIHNLPHIAQESILKIQPVTFFFDETECVDLELATWIEECIIRPLVMGKRYIIVWTARLPWRWKVSEVRRHLSSEGLSVFDEESIRLQILSNSSQPQSMQALYQNVYAITKGHPFASAVVIQQINDWIIDEQVFTSENVLERKPELHSKIFEKVVQQYAFEELDRYQKIACELLAMVRLFDTSMIKRILSTHHEDFSNWAQEDFEFLKHSLKKTYLLVWDRSYTLHPALRHLICEYYLLCNRRKYIEIHRTALSIYQEWLSRTTDHRSWFIVEELYHAASLSRAGEPVDLEGIFKKRLEEYPVWIGDSGALSRALEILMGDLEYDEELNQVTHNLARTTLVQYLETVLDNL